MYLKLTVSHKVSFMINYSWRSWRHASAPVVFLLSGVLSTQADFPTTLESLSPVGYWRLEESIAAPQNLAINSGSAGAIGNGTYLLEKNPGDIHPAAGALVGSSDSGATFTGGEWVSVPNNPAYNLQGSFTIEGWISPSAAPGGLTCPLSFAQAGNPRSGWFLYQNNVDGQGWDFRMFNNNGLSRALDISGGALPQVGTWYLIAISYDAGANLATLYVNGAAVASGSPVGYVPNIDGSFSIGARSDDGFGYSGSIDEVALYDHPLTPAVLLSHYNNGTSSTPSTPYNTLVQQETPVLYYRLDEPTYTPPTTLPVAANLGSWGSTGNAGYDLGAIPGQPGVPGTGFPTPNKALDLNGSIGSVIIPAGQPLNTDTVSYTAWVKPNGPQTGFNAVLFQRGENGSTTAATGFGFGDQNDLRMHWENTEYDWIPGLAIPPYVWSFIACVVTPTNTTLYVNGTSASHDATHAAHDFFQDPIYIGLDPTGGRIVNGEIDEVAIYDHALSTNDLNTLFAAAPLAPEISTQPSIPSGTIFEGSTLTLNVSAIGNSPLTYKWFKGASQIQTGPTLSLTNVTAASSGTYFATVQNSLGTATSAPVNLTVVAGPPFISTAPRSLNLLPGGTANFSVAAGGSIPLSFQWFHTNAPIAGATNNTLTIPQLGTSDGGDYYVVVTNPYGSITNHALLTILPLTTPYSEAVASLGAVAYWKLDETSGPLFADSIGSLDGKLNATVTLGVPGPVPPTDAGFSPTNTAVKFDGKTSDLTAPPLNLHQQTTTITAWINPSVQQTLISADFDGLIFCRGTQTVAAGIDFYKGTGDLAYTWNNNAATYNWDSGLAPAIGVWNFVALVVEADQATLYLDAGNGLTSAVNAVTHTPEVFDGPLHFGTDPSGNRLYQGSLDQVAIFNHALSPAEVQSLRDAGVTGKFTPSPVTITQDTVVQDPPGPDTLVGTRLSLFAGASGGQPLTYQWQKNGQDIPGAVRNSYTIASATTNDSGTYHLVVSQGATKLASKDATITIHAPPNYLSITNGLVLHLPFDNSYSDTAGDHNDGTPEGGPTFVGGKIGSGALHYVTTTSSGVVTSASYVELNNPSDLAIGPGDDFSVAYWINFVGLPGDLPFFGNTKTSYGDFGIDFASSYKLGGWSWWLKDTGSVGSSAGLYSPVNNDINDGNWHSLVHVFHRLGNAITYLDGVAVNTTDIGGLASLDLSSTGNTWEIGQAGGGTYGEAGAFSLDDLGFWRRALTDYEARSIYIVGNGYGRSFDVPAPPSVTLTVSTDGTRVTIGWSNGTLQSASSPTGPWINVGGASAPKYTFTPSAGSPALFYRASF